MRSAPCGEAVFTAYAKRLIRFKSKQLSRLPGFTPSDEEEIAQELGLRLWRKAHLYDPNRGASWNTYANRVVSSESKMILRERGRKKRAGGFGLQSIDVPPATDARLPALSQILSEADRRRAIGSPDQLAIDEREALATVFGVLPPNLRRVWQILETKPIFAVAKELGVSRRQLAKIIDQLRCALDQAGFGPN